MKKLSDGAIGVLSFIAAVMLASVAIHYLELPVVQESHATKKCVKVIFPNGKLGDCDNLPEKYIHEWVE